MSNQDRPSSEENFLLHLPVFELSYAFDDEDDPNYVTVFVDSEPEVFTHWISIEADYAVPLDEVI